MTWAEQIKRDVEARHRLGIRGRFPYPSKWYTDFGLITGIDPVEVFGKILSMSIDEQIRRYYDDIR